MQGRKDNKGKAQQRPSLERELRAVPEDIIEALVARYLAREITREDARRELTEAGYIREDISPGYFQTKWNSVCVRGRAFTAPRKLESHGKAIDSALIMEHWDHERNAELGLDPAKLGASSGKSAYFKCPAGKHDSSLRQLKNLHKDGGVACPSCAHEEGAARRSATVPRLDVQRPGLCDHIIDGTEPSALLRSSQQVVRWQHPDCGHPAYEMSVSSRCAHPDDWCPYCSQAEHHPPHHRFWQTVRDIVPPHIDVFIDQNVLPLDPTLPEGARQGTEIDVLIPELKIGFEYNGKEHYQYGTRYHEGKVERARDIGVELVHVWAEDWEDDYARPAIIEEIMMMCDLHGPVLDVDWEGDMEWVA